MTAGEHLHVFTYNLRPFLALGPRDPVDYGAGYDDTVGNKSQRLDMLAARHAKSYRQWQIRATSHACEEVGQPRGKLASRPGDPSDADAVDKARGLRGDETDPLVAGRWRDEADEVEAVAPQGLPGQGGLFRGQVDQDHGVGAGARGVGGKGLEPVSQHRVEVAHEDDGRLPVALADAADKVDARRRRRAGLKG